MAKTAERLETVEPAKRCDEEMKKFREETVYDIETIHALREAKYNETNQGTNGKH
uniref:Uncharacterized protein n=1 Tax=Syphacia muris TaxID=451379 RepID=A0A0N5AQV0_9BILA